MAAISARNAASILDLSSGDSSSSRDSRWRRVASEISFIVASSPSRFTPDHLSEGVRAKVGVKAAGGDHVHLPAEEVFEVRDKVHEVPEGGLSPGKLDEDIDVACRGLLPPGDGAEDADPSYAE